MAEVTVRNEGFFTLASHSLLTVLQLLPYDNEPGSPNTNETSAGYSTGGISRLFERSCGTEVSSKTVFDFWRSSPRITERLVNA